MTEDPNSQEIWDAVAEEVKYGAMTPPTPVTSPEDLNDCVVSRRFMVEQVKEKHGQQVQAFRQIDHLTESGINPATAIQETLENDTLDLFFNIVRVLLSAAQSSGCSKKTYQGPSEGSPSMNSTCDSWWYY